MRLMILLSSETSIWVALSMLMLSRISPWNTKTLKRFNSTSNTYLTLWWCPSRSSPTSTIVWMLLQASNASWSLIKLLKRSKNHLRVYLRLLLLSTESLLTRTMLEFKTRLFCSCSRRRLTIYSVIMLNILQMSSQRNSLQWMKC